LVLDTHASTTIYVLVSLFFLISTTTYGGILWSLPDASCSKRDNFFGCAIAETVIKWALLGLLLSAFGLAIIVPLSTGNDPSKRTLVWPLVGVFTALVYTVVPWLLDDMLNYESRLYNIVEEETYNILVVFCLTVGLIIAVLFALRALFDGITFNGAQSAGTLPAYSTICNEAKIHCAAKKKVNDIVLNALKLHDVEESSPQNVIAKSKQKALLGTRDPTHRNFILHGERKEKTGGILRTWWQIGQGTLLEKEGIWLTVRLLVIQYGQVLLVLLGSVFFFRLTEQWARAADDYRTELSDKNYPDSIMDVFPRGDDIRRAFYPASVFATIIMFFLLILYIPSAVATVMKYRSGVSPSLGSPYFEKFRVSVDLTYMNTGNALYGMAGSGLLFYHAVGGICFLFYYPSVEL